MTCEPIGVDELCRWCHVSAIDGHSILPKLKLARKVQGILCAGCRAFIKTVNALKHVIM